MVLDLILVHCFHFQPLIGGKNVAIFGVDDSSSVYINNKKKDILFLEEGPTQGLDDTKMTEDAKYFINFPISQMTYCLDLH